jgi:PAS domain S-box-containing protein
VGAAAAAASPKTVEERIRLLAEQTLGHAIVLLDLDGRILWWNGAAERTFARPTAEVLGRASGILFTPEDRELGVDRQEIVTARAGTPAEDDRWMLRGDGSRFWATGLLVPIRAPGGEFAGFGKILRDRTDLRALLDTLRSRLSAAAEGDRHKDVFLATLSHELRNPLSGLASSLEALRRVCGDGSTATRALENADRQLGVLRSLVDELLDVSRIGAGKLELAREPLVVQEVVRTAADSVASEIERRRHRLELLLIEHPMVVSGDAARLRRVFVNLLENAAKYTPDGGRIWVKGTIESGEAVVHVEDDGIGIAPELQPRIFELFTQIDTSLAGARGGLGIGLALVHEIVSAHGGTVQVRSEGAGSGSSFAVRLPLSETAPRG